MASALAIVKLVNTGILVWDQVGPLVANAMEKGEDIDLEEVGRRSGRSTAALQNLAEAIERAESEGR